MPGLTSLSLTQIIHALQCGDFSARQLTLAYLAQIDSLEPQLLAFLTETPEIALRQADAADRKLAMARKTGLYDLSPLTGIPIAIKDVLATKGIRSTAGSRILENFIPPYNATAVSRILDAGMVTLGKTNTDEFAMGSSTENSAYQTSRNPWELSCVPGGSSGGSAVAVSAKMAPIALGTDTGGSVRQPASFCNLTGLKPTYGRISRYGLIAYGSSLDSVGILGQNVLDVAQVFQVIAGHDPRDATSARTPVERFTPDPDPSIRGLRLGIPTEYFINGIQPEVEAAVRRAVKVLEGLGVIVQEINLPHTQYAVPVYYLIATAEASANLARFDGIRYGPRIESEAMWDVYRKTRGELFGQEVKRRIMLGTYALSAGYYDAYYGKAQKVRTLICQDFADAFQQVDLIAAPVAPTTAFKIGCHRDDPLAMYLEDIYTLPANLAGIPALALPVGFDHEGLPIGMQVMASHFQEISQFRLANVYQAHTDWHTHQPGILNA
jgi:aspartyl-tRNA(Asn)/glutamyl-tRNA(Gln) amidotransferase subunit A